MPSANTHNVSVNIMTLFPAGFFWLKIQSVKWDFIQ